MLSFWLTLCIIGFLATLIVPLIPESDYEHTPQPSSESATYLAARERNLQEFLARRQRDVDGTGWDGQDPFHRNAGRCRD